MSPVTSLHADKRFRRAHVKPGQKRRRARWQPIAAYAAVIAALALGCYRVSIAAAQAHVLQVDRIVVHGNERLSKGEVMAVLTGLRGESLVWTDLDAWRRRLLASPWVGDAALRRSLPSTVEVVISERQPVCIGRINNDMYLVDDRGVIIDQYGPQYTDLDLPIVDGLAASSPNDSPTMTDEARADLAARVIAAIRAKPAIARRLSQIDVSDAHNAKVILSGDPAMIYLGDDQFLPRLESYLQLAAALRERVAEIDYVDVRFEDRIYVRPAGAPARRAGKAASSTPAPRPGKPATGDGAKKQ
jgi:cell division protein FtsQ